MVLDSSRISVRFCISGISVVNRSTDCSQESDSVSGRIVAIASYCRTSIYLLASSQRESDSERISKDIQGKTKDLAVSLKGRIFYGKQL